MEAAETACFEQNIIELWGDQVTISSSQSSSSRLPPSSSSPLSFIITHAINLSIGIIETGNKNWKEKEKGNERDDDDDDDDEEEAEEEEKRMKRVQFAGGDGNFR